MVVHIASATLVVSTTPTVPCVFLQLRQLSSSLNLKINIFALLGIKDVFESLHVRTLHIEYSTCIIFEAPHSFDVLADLFGRVATDNVPDERDGIEWFLHSNLESYAVFLAVEEGAFSHLFFVVAGE